MKKFLWFSVVFLSACTPGYKEANFTVLPPDLKDCKIFYLTNTNGSRITVSRCPNSTTSTSYRAGKITHNSVVIDGETYIKQDKETE